jgi:hypothetical protein
MCNGIDDFTNETNQMLLGLIDELVLNELSSRLTACVHVWACRAAMMTRGYISTTLAIRFLIYPFLVVGIHTQFHVFMNMDALCRFKSPIIRFCKLPMNLSSFPHNATANCMTRTRQAPG